MLPWTNLSGILDAVISGEVFYLLPYDTKLLVRLYYSSHFMLSCESPPPALLDIKNSVGLV